MQQYNNRLNEVTHSFRKYLKVAEIIFQHVHINFLRKNGKEYVKTENTTEYDVNSNTPRWLLSAFKLDVYKSVQRFIPLSLMVAEFVCEKNCLDKQKDLSKEFVFSTV